MNTIVLCVGSNSRDRDWQIQHAIEWLKKLLSNTQHSSTYDAPADNHRDPDYLNVVMRGETRLDFQNVYKKVKEYETVCGRTPASKLTGNVPMDLDIIMWNEDVIRPDDFKKPYFQRGWTELNE